MHLTVMMPFRSISFVGVIAGLAVAAAAQGPQLDAALPDAPSTVIASPLQAAQTGRDTQSASISGSVNDSAGALVPGASVALLMPGGGRRYVTSDSTASYRFVGLPAGTYTLSIIAPGLEPLTTGPITLTAGQHLERAPDALKVVSNVVVTVNANSYEVAEEELHIEEQQRMLGVIPNFLTSFLWNAAPLSPKQKFKLAFKVNTDPFSLIGFGALAGIQTANDTYPTWGPHWDGFAKRYAAAAGDSILSRQLDSAILPALFHEDPRYFYMGPNQPGKKRFLHAVGRAFVTRRDDGKTVPNYSHLLGNAGAGALSSVYHPHTTSAGTLALDNTLLRIAGDMLSGLGREFIFERFTTHVPGYNKGEPKD